MRPDTQKTGSAGLADAGFRVLSKPKRTKAHGLSAYKSQSIDGSIYRMNRSAAEVPYCICKKPKSVACRFGKTALLGSYRQVLRLSAEESASVVQGD